MARGPPDRAEGILLVGIGASAGGLDAARKLMAALGRGTGMAFILVQHLDPTHQSMMVELLAGHTAMTVREASDGLEIAPGNLYVIPPGTYLSVSKGTLHLTQPQARHGARLPFDFLLHAMAEAYGQRAVCVILSGSGSDGSLGLKAIKAHNGLVIAQEPTEADYDGMVRSAILTGAVDFVLPVAEIPAALAKYQQGLAAGPLADSNDPDAAVTRSLAAIIDLIRVRLNHDFRLYKPGTLLRRIERRMAMAAIDATGIDRYVDLLRRDQTEVALLANDLLINVTSFFRDPSVFDLLATSTVPDLVSGRSADQPIRVWVAGCSTGEETYSLAMLFVEAIEAANLSIKLQLFASDVDPTAIAAAREGLYPESIATDVSPARLARFFSKEERGYRILPELRARVVFTVQDVLADPPFSRIDMVSCRNLLIYLRPEAQQKVTALFHFALREGGVLLLGSSETVADANGSFQLISKSARLYRHTARSRPGELAFAMSSGDSLRAGVRPGPAPPPSRQSTLAELCRKAVVENYAPAAILINQRHECLYFLGPTDRFLRVAPGHPTHDILAMVQPDVRNKLRSALQRAAAEKTRIVVSGGRTTHEGAALSFRIAAQHVQNGAEELLLVCFIEETGPDPRQARPTTGGGQPELAALESELEITRAELQSAIRDLESSSEEQKAINEEALSVNEEYQSTNEELMTSKEELQSLNEELTALNSQLQETLERQRTTSNDLQNILYSTDIATLFLDAKLDIRFFTPATRAIFSVIPSDIGRPLADLNSLAVDLELLNDALMTLKNSVPIEREIEGQNGAWYLRRVLPYRTAEHGVDGVVITFTDITERKRVAKALEVAKQQAEAANAGKSRFLASASHDLRQPLQTLALLQGLLSKKVEGGEAKKLVDLMDPTLSAMSGMLNTLLDINQIDAGTVQPEMVRFPINGLLTKLLDEFTYHAEARGLALHVVPSSAVVYSDPRLLEQIMRNLLSNALKYTRHGKVLLGCRHNGAVLSIEVWDTGIGIPPSELQAIFVEYHQLDNEARERSRGLGLGLPIVQRLADLLGHRVHVRSNAGRGSMFAVEVGPPPDHDDADPDDAADNVGDNTTDAARTGTILAIEDDPELRELLDLVLTDEGHRVMTAPDGVTALELVGRGRATPSLILADYNLPNGLDGLQTSAALRLKLRADIPVIVLTGDISTETLREIANMDCLQISKPVQPAVLTRLIRELLPATDIAAIPPPPVAAGSAEAPVVIIVDDDKHICDGVRRLFEKSGTSVEDFATSEAFLAAYQPSREACLLIDSNLPGMPGLELLQRVKTLDHHVPAIMITGDGDVHMAVDAMKAGAFDFLEKPFSPAELLATVDRALEQGRDIEKLSAWHADAADHLAGLTDRQRQVMDMVLAGHPSKNIAADLGISQRTVENHRATIMKKTGTKSLPALARLAIAAAKSSADGQPAAR
jgi:two-component system CheB/CheR fusion protein